MRTAFAALTLMVLVTLLVPTGADAQTAPTAEQAAQAAVMALPEALRADAHVVRYEGTEAEVLREGNGAFVCLADDPSDDRFHVTCYHESLDPFMASGRALRAEGYEGAAVDSLRQVQIDQGAWSMPEGPAALYSLSGPAGSFDYAAGQPRAEAGRLHVIYTPYATEASTGLPPRGAPGTPWLMEGGTPWAHVMVVVPAATAPGAEN